MTPTSYGLIFAGGLLFGMIMLLETGRRIAIRRIAQDPEGAHKGLGVVEGAVFSLLGLLIAFTFAHAATRFDDRRQLIIEEANDIGTAYLRIDLLSESARPAMRQLFREYLDSRLATYHKLADVAAAKAELAPPVASGITIGKMMRFVVIIRPRRPARRVRVMRRPHRRSRARLRRRPRVLRRRVL
jgi:hypothetical protein